MNTINKYCSRPLWFTAILLTAFVTGCNSNNGTSTAAANPAALSVISTSPAAAELDVATNQKITATFSESMDATTLHGTSFTVQGANNEAAMIGDVTLDAAGNTAIFTPNTDLTAGIDYTATITMAAASTTGKTMASDYAWIFSIGAAPDTTAPAVVSKSPANGDIDVLLNQNISATFDEALDPNTVDDTSFTLTADAGLTVITGSVSYIDLVATFNPSLNLLESTEYTATLTTAITDLAVPANSLTPQVQWKFTTGIEVATGPPAIDLGTAANFAIMTATGVTSANASAVITGHIGVSGTTGASISVACSEMPGFNMFTDNAEPSTQNCLSLDKGAAATALGDVLIAYTNASDPATPAGVGPFLELGAGTVTAQTLIPGVYTWAGNVNITGDLTLEGSATDVWVFQIDGTLDTAKAINLTGGALAENVFWRVADVVTLGTGAKFTGIVLAKTKVDMISTATIEGRLLAQTAVNLGSDTKVTQPQPLP